MRRGLPGELLQQPCRELEDIAFRHDPHQPFFLDHQQVVALLLPHPGDRIRNGGFRRNRSPGPAASQHSPAPVPRRPPGRGAHCRRASKHEIRPATLPSSSSTGTCRIPFPVHELDHELHRFVGVNGKRDPWS